MIKTKLTKKEAGLKAGLTPRQLAAQKDEAVADQRGYVDSNKWAHICGALQNHIAELYEMSA
jgi:hypothetical protein